MEQQERARKVLAGERPPRRMPPPPDEPKASKATKRPRGRPAYPRAQPGEKKARADEQGSPTAQAHGDDAAEQQANQFDEVISLIAFHLAGKLESNSDPDNESADDDLDEEAPLQLARAPIGQHRGSWCLAPAQNYQIDPPRSAPRALRRNDLTACHQSVSSPD
ncbi:hypothetical protein [Sorangium sp. So ce1182]|uniref:hypothetical protein n=1 Tax=Sorangium sp. So ce1182 TaxID=3133334 RepID=UPI003F62EFBF